MAEREAAHRHSLEERAIQAQIAEGSKHFAEARCGQICALIITLAGMGIGGYVAIQGHEIAGSILGVGGIGGIVTTFILGRKQESQPEQPEEQETPKTQRKRKRR
jgi:uncharacterized membrane protein